MSSNLFTADLRRNSDDGSGRSKAVSASPRGSLATDAFSTAKAGEVLIFRPRARPRTRSIPQNQHRIKKNAAVILHSGREFHTTRARAESFLRWARAVAESGQAALVPLVHRDGADLLLITGDTPVASSRQWP